ncbi:unnamed protein product [Wuchereria bancrofti]|uniref:Uncharacterized protein n=1 Tax=Wuchereria bancrofti TaxID=6293 RepID=A0A3P7E8F9_WUCBA|nr:unnamed protein product [Wuchereria bancrofti]
MVIQQQQQQPEKVYSSKPNLRQTSKADIISHSKVLLSDDNDIAPLFATTTLNDLSSIEIKTSTFNQQCQEHLAESDESPIECIPGTMQHNNLINYDDNDDNDMIKYYVRLSNVKKKTSSRR